MKAALLIASALLLGCSHPGLHSQQLSAGQAAALAQKLANDKAHALYHCRPFADGAAPQIHSGVWTWNDRKGWGTGDFEATVTFAADGANPEVRVFRLYDVIR